MSTNAPTEVEGTDDNRPADPRDRRALTEYMSVLPEGGDVYSVVGENGGGEYAVDVREGRCTCPDHTYRGVRCKHLRRVEFATGERAVPPGVDVNELLGEHTDATVRFAATDGGTATEAPASGRGRDHDQQQARHRVAVAGGVLVYDVVERGVRELAGFEDVDDWDALADGLAARGHAVGAIYHLPELDAGAA